MADGMYRREQLGWVEIGANGAVVAGSVGTWRLTYHVGSLGIDDGGRDWSSPVHARPSGRSEVEEKDRKQENIINSRDSIAVRNGGGRP